MEDVYESCLRVLVGVAVVGCCYLIHNFVEKRKLEANDKFRELVKTADVDKDGNLSDIEKDLLYARPDSNCIPSLYYSVCLPWDEKYNISFGDLHTIEKTIKNY